MANVESVLLKAALPKDAAPSTARDGAKAAEPKPAIVVDHVKISGDWVAARSPVFSNSGKDVAFLGSNMSSHNGCCALCVAAVPAAREGVASQPRTVLPVVGACAPLGAFPGIYAVRLPRRAWATDDASILVNTHWASALAAVRVDVRSGATERLISGPHGAGAAGDTAAPGARASVYVADTCGDDALLVVSSFDSPDAVQLAVRGDGASVNREGAVLPAAGEAPLRSILEAVEWRVLPVAPRDGGPAFETTLLLPRGARGLPLLVMPHGGPHSSWTTEFLSSIAFLVGASPGVGRDFVCLMFALQARGSPSHSSTTADPSVSAATPWNRCLAGSAPPMLPTCTMPHRWGCFQQVTQGGGGFAVYERVATGNAACFRGIR